MSRSLRHGALAATAIVFSIASLTACGAGNDAATLKVRPDTAATTIGDISVQNANVVTQPEHSAEGPAVVSATLFNSGTKPQTLEAVTLPGSSASVQLHAAKGAGPVVVPAAWPGGPRRQGQCLRRDREQPRGRTGGQRTARRLQVQLDR